MRLIPLIALLALSTATGAVDKVQSLNIKLGLWEVTTTVTANTEIPIPAGLLEKLTPEQRARVEERIKARSSDTPKVIHRTYCLTKEQLNKGPTFGRDWEFCRRIILASTSDRLEMRFECASQPQEIKSSGSGTLQVEATDQENVKGYVRRSISGDRLADSSSMFTAKWISPICSGETVPCNQACRRLGGNAQTGSCPKLEVACDGGAHDSPGLYDRLFRPGAALSNRMTHASAIAS